ncbi:unnamed protein product, partial [Pylaiella littoralis]
MSEEILDGGAIAETPESWEERQARRARKRLKNEEARRQWDALEAATRAEEDARSQARRDEIKEVLSHHVSSEDNTRDEEYDFSLVGPKKQQSILPATGGVH